VTDILEKGLGWLEDQRDIHRTDLVRYKRDTFSVGINATVGRTLFEVDKGRGILEKIESRDFLVLTKDLILDGKQTLPERGDVIRETRGTATFVYEVMAPGKEPHYRYSDPYRKTLRIHSKLVDTERAP
jgi:hypothetical protein